MQRRATAALLGGVTALTGAVAPAQTWTFTPSVTLQETLTSNVNLSSSATAKSDLVSQLTPQLAIDEKGTRTSLHGFIAAPILLYARTGAENNQIYPSVNLLGNVEALERFFFVEGAVSVSQQYFNPFGAQPVGLANATQNRYTNATYRVTPYIQGEAPGNIKYEVRNNNVWSNLSGAPIATGNSHFNQWLGKVSGPVAQFGWAADVNWSETKFTDQERPTVTELARGRLLYQPDPQLRFDIAGGYEENRYPLTDYRGAIYGAGIQWSPTPRTNVIGNWEHRFFGSSYLFSFEHRTPLSAINVRASRDTTSYPQNFLSIPATGNVPLLLFILLQNRIPDPAQRLQFILQLMQDQGLPSTLSSPVNLYAQQTYLQENFTVTYGLLGARNNIFVTGFRIHTQPISGAGNPLPPIFDPGGNNNTQTGATITWNHNLTGLVTLNASATAVRTVGNGPFEATTRQGAATVGLTAVLSAHTSASVGARYQVLRSDVSSEYTEGAVFGGFTYTFK